MFSSDRAPKVGVPDWMATRGDSGFWACSSFLAHGVHGHTVLVSLSWQMGKELGGVLWAKPEVGIH